MIFMSHVFTFVIFLMAGLLIGKVTIKYTNKFYDCSFIILTILSLRIGTNSYLLKTFNFEVGVSTVLTALFLGIVIRRLSNRFTLIRKLN